MNSIFLTITFLILFSSCQKVVKPIAGNFQDNIEEAKGALSKETRAYIEKAFEGSESECHVDFHVHAVGVGAEGTGAWVNPKMMNIFSLKHYIKYQVYMSASGIKDFIKADQEYLLRLVSLIKNEPRLGRHLLFAFDLFHDKEGRPVKDKSTFFIPNDYVIKIAEKYPKIFLPVASIHPYRKDALRELERVWGKGVRFIKWLPNAQHIDASDSRSLKFLNLMKSKGMTLITHTGDEKAVEGDEYQKLGNPLIFRKALDQGVPIVMAHFASLGVCEDLDNPSSEKKSCFDLFWRLMKEEKYKENLWGETSALALYTRLGKPMLSVLENPEMASRFVHGSDYPLPAINVLYRTSQLLKEGYINEKDKEALDEVYGYNPLLFNHLLKRVVKHPKTKKKMSPEVFYGKSLVSCNKTD